MTAAIDIMVPVRNGGPLLGECLASILAQTEADLRLVVVDNASTDDTPQTVAAIDDPRIDYHRYEEGVSLSGNFNRCLDLAEAPFFALVHADDRVLPDYAATLMDAAEQDPTAWLVFCKGELIDEHGAVFEPVKQRIKNNIYDRRGPVLEGMSGLHAAASYNHLMAPCAIYRTALIPPDLRYVEGHHYLTDQVFWVKTLAAGGRIRQIGATLYQHRVHSGQLSARLRASGATLDEIDQFDGAASAAGVGGVWRRYGAKLALRSALVNLASARIGAGLKDMARMARFVLSSFTAGKGST